HAPRPSRVARRRAGPRAHDTGRLGSGGYSRRHPRAAGRGRAAAAAGPRAPSGRRAVGRPPDPRKRGVRRVRGRRLQRRRATRVLGRASRSTLALSAVRMQALIFDLDGTLVDTVYAHVFAWQRAFAEAGLAIDGWRIHRRIGLSSGLLSGGYGDDELARAGAFRVYRDTAELHRSLDELGVLP